MQPQISSGSARKIPPKFIIGGLFLAAAVIYLIISSTQANVEYFLTVDEVLSKRASLEGKTIRLSGAVLGESIHYDPQTMELTFTVAHIPGDYAVIEKAGGLALVLHQAISDPKNHTINIYYKGPQPDLLKNESQAILTGKLRSDGVFAADEILLKCPTRYEGAVPDQAGRR
ncbi:cytochrome c maturation protein CcmE [Leptolinea tardivitalis]|nr:cytochrome c maturation protein CcmE [Leptolinea tardivitalis]